MSDERNPSPGFLTVQYSGCKKIVNSIVNIQSVDTVDRIFHLVYDKLKRFNVFETEKKIHFLECAKVNNFAPFEVSKMLNNVCYHEGLCIKKCEQILSFLLISIFYRFLFVVFFLASGVYSKLEAPCLHS